MTGAALAAMGGVERIVLSGTLSKTSASSPVVSNTITVTNPPSNTGRLVFSMVASDAGTPQYQKNADAFANITEGLEVTFANNDTIIVKCVLGSTQQASFIVTDKDTAHIVDSPLTTLART